MTIMIRVWASWFSTANIADRLEMFWGARRRNHLLGSKCNFLISFSETVQFESMNMNSRGRIVTKEGSGMDRLYILFVSSRRRFTPVQTIKMNKKIKEYTLCSFCVVMQPTVRAIVRHNLGNVGEMSECRTPAWRSLCPVVLNSECFSIYIDSSGRWKFTNGVRSMYQLRDPKNAASSTPRAWRRLLSDFFSAGHQRRSLNAK